MKWEYFHALIDPRRPVGDEWATMLRNGRYRLHTAVALYDGMVYAIYEREAA